MGQRLRSLHLHIESNQMVFSPPSAQTLSNVPLRHLKVPQWNTTPNARLERQIPHHTAKTSLKYRSKNAPEIYYLHFVLRGGTNLSYCPFNCVRNMLGFMRSCLTSVKHPLKLCLWATQSDMLACQTRLSDFSAASSVWVMSRRWRLSLKGFYC